MAVLAAIAAVAPIAAAIFGAGTGHRTAFASAPSGLYAIAVTDQGDHDDVIAARADDPAAISQVAQVPHLFGFTSNGAVSPDGQTLALVTVDGGTPARPVAALLLLDLESGDLTRRVENIDPLQKPLWSPTGDAVYVTRPSATDQQVIDVTVLRAPVGGGSATAALVAKSVLGAYAVGFDANGALLTVAIDNGGSRLIVGQGGGFPLSAFITRDWQVSPDGSQIAFIESDTSDGLRYRERVVTLDGSGAGAVTAAQVAAPGGQQLGAAWRPGSAEPTFGEEPATATPSGGAAVAQSVTGFDIPLSYSPDGVYLALEAWDGASFDAPGNARLTIEGPGGRAQLQAARFYGWAQR
jgi:hypothetical protein